MTIISDITEKLNRIVSEQCEIYNDKEYVCSLSYDNIMTIKLAVGVIEMLQEFTT